MAVSELFRSSALPPGYNVSAIIDGARFARKMVDKESSGKLNWTFRLRYEGGVERREEGALEYSGTEFFPKQLRFDIQGLRAKWAKRRASMN